MILIYPVYPEIQNDMFNYMHSGVGKLLLNTSNESSELFLNCKIKQLNLNLCGQLNWSCVILKSNKQKRKMQSMKVQRSL